MERSYFVKIPEHLDGLSKREIIRRYLLLEERVKELERRLLAYENAHTPPSQQRHYPKRERKGNGKVGAPEGHDGITREKPEPTETKELCLDVCPDCHNPLGEPVRVERRLVEEIPEPQPLRIILFVIFYYYCPFCNKEVCASHPELPVEGNLGINLQSQVALMKYEDRLPCRKIASSLNRQYGLKFCPATVLDVLRRVADRLSGFYEKIKQDIRKSAVINSDDTGAKVQGKNHHFWTFVGENAVLFRFSKRREAKAIEEVLGTEYSGLLGCDGYKAYEKYAKEIQRCWAHLLREAEFLAEKHEGQAKLLYNALKKMFKKINKVTLETPLKKREKLHNKLLNELNSWVQTCKAYTELRKITTTIENGVDYWLTCVLHPEIEPTNNKAERALREFVIQRKIIGTLRNEKGTRTTEIIMSAIATWKQQGLNPYSLLRINLSS